MPDTRRQDRFRELYQLNAPDVFRFALRRVVEPGDAAEVVAEVFLTAWRRLDDVPDSEDARLWLFGTARFVILNERRRRRRSTALAARLQAELRAHPPFVEPPAEAGGVLAALYQLSIDDRELLMLTGWDGFSPAQCAVLLEVSPATLRVRLHRARNRLRAVLAGDDAVGEPTPPSGQVHDRHAAAVGSDRRENR